MNVNRSDILYGSIIDNNSCSVTIPISSSWLTESKNFRKCFSSIRCNTRSFNNVAFRAGSRDTSLSILPRVPVMLYNTSPASTRRDWSTLWCRISLCYRQCSTRELLLCFVALDEQRLDMELLCVIIWLVQQFHTLAMRVHCVRDLLGSPNFYSTLVLSFRLVTALTFQLYVPWACYNNLFGTRSISSRWIQRNKLHSLKW